LRNPRSHRNCSYRCSYRSVTTTHFTTHFRSPSEQLRSSCEL